MQMDAIIAALVTGVLSLFGVIITNYASNARLTRNLEKAQAVMNAKIEALTQEVREHNNFVRRVPVLEEKAKVADHRLTDLERIQPPKS